MVGNLDQNVAQASNVTFGTITANGDTQINGAFATTDTIIVLNSAESGSGVTGNLSGLEIERGSSTNYQIVYDEAVSALSIGLVGSLQAVAEREDTPTSDGLAVWNTSNNRFQTSNVLIQNGSQLEVTSTGTGAIRVISTLSALFELNPAGITSYNLRS